MGFRFPGTVQGRCRLFPRGDAIVFLLTRREDHQRCLSTALLACPACGDHVFAFHHSDMSTIALQKYYPKLRISVLRALARAPAHRLVWIASVSTSVRLSAWFCTNV